MPAWLGQGLLGSEQLGWLLQGLVLTITLSAAVILTGLILGVLLGIARQQGHWPWLALPHNALRNTPLLVQVLFWYFAVGGMLPEAAKIWLNTPHVLWQWQDLSLGWPSFEFLAAWWSLSLYAMAYMAEDVRSGLNAVPRGQWEAAQAHGLRPWQVLRWIILPQAWQIARIPLLGQGLNTIKNTSLTMAIGVMELSYRSRQVDAQTLLTFQAFAVATLPYVLLNLLTQRWAQPRLEAKR